MGSQSLMWLLLLAAMAGSLIKLGVPWELVQWYQLCHFKTLGNIFGVLYAVYTLSRRIWLWDTVW